jgi:hypothetical protein
MPRSSKINRKPKRMIEMFTEDTDHLGCEAVSLGKNSKKTWTFSNMAVTA